MLIHPWIVAEQRIARPCNQYVQGIRQQDGPRDGDYQAQGSEPFLEQVAKGRDRHHVEANVHKIRVEEATSDHSPYLILVQYKLGT